MNEFKITKHGKETSVRITDMTDSSGDEFEAYYSYLESNFGPGGTRKKYRWRVGWTKGLVMRNNSSLPFYSSYVFYFRKEIDATMFVLKWS